MTNYVTLIDENECIGDSLDTINANFYNLDLVGTILSAQAAVITPLSTTSGLIYNIGTNAPLLTLNATDGIFEYLNVSKNQNDTNFIVYTNFASGSQVEITTRYATLSSGYVTGDLETFSYADIAKTIQGDFVINNADGAGELIFGTDDTERVNIKPDGEIVVRATPESIAQSLPGDRVYVKSNGSIGLGIDPDPLFQLEVATDSVFKPTGGVWGTSSDERLKQNIELADTEICYNVVKNLPLKRFTWRDDIYSSKQVGDRSVVGWIAQDVKSVFPKGVKEITRSFKTEESSEPIIVEDCLTLDASQIYATLYGAVQQLMTVVEQQSAAITDLQNQINQLQNS